MWHLHFLVLSWRISFPATPPEAVSNIGRPGLGFLDTLLWRARVGKAHEVLRTQSQA